MLNFITKHACSVAILRLIISTRWIRQDSAVIHALESELPSHKIMLK
jgi:hypothetical protein